MIEIVFNELNQNTLKLAQKYGEGIYPGGYSFITYYNEDGTLMSETEAMVAQAQAEIEEAKRWKDATPLGGNKEDVFDFSMKLNLGDISCWENLDKRIESFSRFKYDQDSFDIVDFENRNQQYVLDDLNMVVQRLKNGESARIWYDDSINGTLGFEWLMWQLKNAEVPLERLLVNHSASWDNMKAGDWHKYVKQEISITKKMAELAVARWEEHMMENAHLRVMENGVAKAASESYYDNFILEEAKNLERDENGFQENWLMGILNEKKPEIPNYWFYTRIEELISRGEFVIIKDSDDGWPKSWKVLQIPN